MFRPMLCTAILTTALAACGSEPDTGTATVLDSEGAVPEMASNARLVDVPDTIALDPCALMDDAALADLEITNVASLLRVAGVETIHNTGTKAAYVGCSWSSPTGVPTMSLRVYDAPDVAMPAELADSVEIGDGGWTAEEGGRVRLYVKAGERLVELSPQAPKYYAADDATYLSRIYQSIATRFDAAAGAAPDSGDLPSPRSICDAVSVVPSKQMFFGDVIALPRVHRVFVADTSGSDLGEFSGCHWADPNNARESVSALYLDDVASARLEKSNGDDWQDVTIAGRPARFARKSYLIDMGEGQMLAVESKMTPRGNELEEAASNIVEALSG